MSLLFLVPDEETKTRLVDFPRVAGGFADRLKGLLFALEWSENAGIPLQVYWQSPLPLRSIFQLKSKQIVELNAAQVLEQLADTYKTVQLINWVDLKAEQIEREMRDVDLLDNSKTHVLFANQFNAQTDADRKNALHRVFNAHLKFNADVKKRAELLLPSLKIREAGDRLLGMQLRIGKYVGAGWNDPFLDSKLNWRLMVNVAKNFCNDVKHFAFLSDAAKLQIGDQGLNEFKPIWSSENVHFELSKNSGQEQLLNTIAEFYLLSQCSHVVHGKGEFGYLAAALGGGVSVDYYTQLSPWQKKWHKWNHRFSRWRISLAKRFSRQATK